MHSFSKSSRQNIFWCLSKLGSPSWMPLSSSVRRKTKIRAQRLTLIPAKWASYLTTYMARGPLSCGLRFLHPNTDPEASPRRLSRKFSHHMDVIEQSRKISCFSSKFALFSSNFRPSHGSKFDSAVVLRIWLPKGMLRDLVNRWWCADSSVGLPQSNYRRESGDSGG